LAGFQLLVHLSSSSCKAGATLGMHAAWMQAAHDRMHTAYELEFHADVTMIL